MQRSAEIFLGAILGLATASGGVMAQAPSDKAKHAKGPTTDYQPAADYPQLERLQQDSIKGVATASIALQGAMSTPLDENLKIGLMRQVGLQSRELCKTHRVEACPAKNKPKSTVDIEDMDDDELHRYWTGKAFDIFTRAETIITQITEEDRRKTDVLSTRTDRTPARVSASQIERNIRDTAALELETKVFKAAVEDEKEEERLEAIEQEAEVMGIPSPPAKDTVAAPDDKPAYVPGADQAELWYLQQQACSALHAAADSLTDTLRVYPSDGVLSEKQLLAINATVAKMDIDHPDAESLAGKPTLQAPILPITTSLDDDLDAVALAGDIGPVVPQPGPDPVAAQKPLSPADLKQSTADFMEEAQNFIQQTLQERDENREGEVPEKSIVVHDVTTIYAIEQLTLTLRKVFAEKPALPAPRASQ